MGVEVAAISLAAIAAGATIAKASAEKESEQANLSAINQQSKLLALQYQEKTIHNLEMTDKILQHQAVQLSTRGVSYSSPSFNAIQRETLNISSKNQSKLNTEKTLADQGLEIERRNVKATLHAQLFGDVAGFAFGAFSAYENFPTKSSSKLPQAESL